MSGDGRLLFHGGGMFDGERWLHPGSALMMDGNMIVQIAPLQEFDGFDGPRRDLAGQTLLPGLIDCHAHITLSGDADVWGSIEGRSRDVIARRALENAQACLRGGITALRDCGGIDHVELEVRDLCNSGAVLGPTIRAAGKFICMTGGTNAPVARIADGPDEVRRAVRDEVRAGCDCIKLMATGSVLTPGTNVDDTQYSCEELQAGVEEATCLGKPTAAHAIGSQGILNAAMAGVTSIEHGMFLTDACIQEMLERGTYLVPTLAAVARILEHADEIDPAVIAKARIVAERHADSVRRFNEAGGRIAMGADTGTPFNPHGQNATELAHMVQAGMTPSQALKAATANAADLLQLPLQGRLRAGHLADLLLVRGNPADNISLAASMAHHVAVYKSGAEVGRNSGR